MHGLERAINMERLIYIYCLSASTRSCHDKGEVLAMQDPLSTSSILPDAKLDLEDSAIRHVITC